MKSFIVFFFSLLSGLLLSISANAQTSVVVIPLGGDAAPLANIVTVAKENGDFDNPIDAVNSITDATGLNPYLVVIAPGKYTLNEHLNMKTGVSIAGSGVDVTIIEGAISAGSIYSCSLIRGADEATLSNMTIRNTGGGAGCSVAIHTLNHDMHIEHVKAIAQGATTAYALHNYSSTVTMSDVHMEGIGAASYGVYNYNAGAISVIKNSLLKGATAGIRIFTGTTRITNTRISGGVYNDAANAQCRDTYDVNLNDVPC